MGVQSNGSMYYRNDTFWDVLGHFGSGPRTAKTPCFLGFYRVFEGRRELAN